MARHVNEIDDWLYKNESLEKAVKSALDQIEDKKYEVELKARGITDILKLGIAFKGKEIDMKAR